MLKIIITKWGTKKTVVWNTSHRPEIIGREARKTKYLGWNSDIISGSVTSRSETYLTGVSKVQKLIAALLNTMDSFLLARGLCTFDVRMQRHGRGEHAGGSSHGGGGIKPRTGLSSG